ncbi:alpha/beta hydrolase [bacterium]|nr:alpha/beta hydrolase [bacterium]
MALSLHCSFSGAGPTLMMLHSGGMSGRQWRKLAEALSPHYRVALPDFLGSGNNPPWSEAQAFDYHQDAEAIEKLLEGLAQPAHLIGHSYGGLIALTLALRNPQAVASLSLYDPVAFGVLWDTGDVEGLDDLSRVAANPVFADDQRGGNEEWMQNFVDYWNGAGAWQQMPEPNRQAFLKVGRKVYCEVRSLSEDRTPLKAYQSLGMPTLLVYGEKTPPAARRVQRLLADTMPNARLQQLKGAGHMGPLTHGPAFQALVEQHLSSL